MFPFLSQPSQRFVSSTGMKLTGNKWIVYSATGVANAIQRLQIEQPDYLDINIAKNITTPTALKQLFAVIKKNFTGGLHVKLWHSFLHYDDCSDAIKVLARSR